MTAPHFAAPIGEPPAIQFVGVDRLKVDGSYQRGIENKTSRSLIDRIARGWDWRLCAPLMVSQRPAGLFVIDGQHRAQAARLRGDIPHLPVVALFDLTLADEARIFAALNHERKAVTYLDSFRAALAADDVEAATVQRLVTDAGLRIGASTREAGTEPDTLAFLPLIERELRKRGEAVVADALALIGRAFAGQVLGAIGGAMFSALTLLLDSYRWRADSIAPHLAAASADAWAERLRATGLTGGTQRAALIRDALIEAAVAAGAATVDPDERPDDGPAEPRAPSPGAGGRAFGLAAAGDSGSPGPGREARGVIALAPPERKVLAALTRAADANRPCPSNAELATALGIVSTGKASELVTALAEKGHIRVQRFAGAREVEIVATGRRTLHEGSRNPHWRERAPAAPSVAAEVAAEAEELARRRKAARATGRVTRPPASEAGEPEADQPRVARDPCPRCGARGDVDCGHPKAWPAWAGGRSFGSSASALA